MQGATGELLPEAKDSLWLFSTAQTFIDWVPACERVKELAREGGF